MPLLRLMQSHLFATGGVARPIDLAVCLILLRPMFALHLAGRKKWLFADDVLIEADTKEVKSKAKEKGCFTSDISNSF